MHSGDPFRMIRICSDDGYRKGRSVRCKNCLFGTDRFEMPEDVMFDIDFLDCRFNNKFTC